MFRLGATQVVAVDGVDLTTDRGEITSVDVTDPDPGRQRPFPTMIGCMLRPTSGRIEIDGLDVTALPAREQPRVRRTLVGFIFQTFNLLDSLTARENVEVALNIGGGARPVRAPRARELLQDAGAR